MWIRLLVSVSCVFALGLFVCPQAHASPSLSLSSPQTSGFAGKLKLRTPALGQHRFQQRLVLGIGQTKANQKGLDIGALETTGLGAMAQPLFGPAFGVIAAIALTFAGIWALGVLSTLGGNIYALASGRGRLGWGIAGVVIGGIGTTGSIIHLASVIGLVGSDPGLLGFILGFFVFHAATLILGALNIAWHRRGENRFPRDMRRDEPRDGFRGQVGVTPWINVGQERELQGGLAMVGTF